MERDRDISDPSESRSQNQVRLERKSYRQGGHPTTVTQKSAEPETKVSLTSATGSGKTRANSCYALEVTSFVTMQSKRLE